MSFEITGQISVKRTNKPLPGLIIQVHDKNMWFENCLGATTTDRKGQFKLVYSEQDFQEVFEKQPEIYLAVYAPPLRHLLNTKQKALWRASGHANFIIEIDGKKISAPATEPQKNQVPGGVSLSSRQLKIATVGEWHIPHLPGFGNGALYGSPSILEQSQYVLIPAGTKVSKVEIIPGPVMRKGRRIKPFPVQRPLIDLPDESSVNRTEPEFVNPDPRYYRGTQPYPEKLVALGYIEEWKGVQKIQVRVRPLQYDPISQQYLFYPRLSYIVHYQPAPQKGSGKTLAVNIVHKRRFISQHFVDYLSRKNVYACPGTFADQFAKPDHFEIPSTPFYLSTPYLIITDNYEWSETNLPVPTNPPTNPGDIPFIHPPTEHGDKLAVDAEGYNNVNHFRRLAKWKVQRGIRSKVVTVSEIVENKDSIYGDLLKRRDVSALDLQDVIRNFIWWAHDNWGIEYVLLGGDTNIIPMRKLIGYVSDQGNAAGWDCMRDQNDDLIYRDQCKYYADGHFTKIHYCGGSDILTEPLLTHQGGKQIKYYQDVPANHFPRWFCVNVDSVETFKNLAKPFTPWNPPPNPDGEERNYYVIVEDNGHHLADINDDYYWVSEGRRIPTDRYYACAGSLADVDDDERDFDKNGNHFYGQFRWDEGTENDVPIDGFRITPDVFIGRAPVRSGAEAKAFVDKVISYEQLARVGDAPSMDLNFLRKVIHVADYSSPLTSNGLVQGEAPAESDVNHPPEGKYTYDNAGRARIQIKQDSTLDEDITLNEGEINFRLIFNDGDDGSWSIPYGGETGHRWHFMQENFADNAISEEKTRFIEVKGLFKKPGNFFWDRVGYDGFHERSNNLRQRMIELYPDFNQIERMYTDHFEPAETGIPEVLQLRKAKLKAKLSEGCHFLTLHGHGNPSGCCKLTASGTYTNNKGTYIAYAHSCSTARPDDYEVNGVVKQQSFGEFLVVQKGGAVAYIGSTRMDGDHLKHGYAEYLWEQIQEHRRLGPASADCDYTGGDFWHFYCRALYGDPEMPVWVKMPKNYLISGPASAMRGSEVILTVKSLVVVLNPGDIPDYQKVDLSQSKPLKDHLVTLMADWNPLDTDEVWKKGPELFLSAKTDSQGKVCFKIPAAMQADKAEITVCACGYSKVSSQYDYKPATRTLTITS